MRTRTLKVVDFAQVKLRLKLSTLLKDSLRHILWCVWFEIDLVIPENSKYNIQTGFFLLLYVDNFRWSPV